MAVFTKHIRSIRDWYAKHERPVSSLSLIGGFVFDALTLKHVEFFWENFWVVMHLLIVAICIILINREENEKYETLDATRLHFWLVNILQFFFGGLLSTFLVFYFRSATLAVTWPFFLLLIAAFVANERLKKHYVRVTFQISLFYLSILSFAVYIVPVLFHRIGADVFLVSGMISLVALWLFLAGLGYFAKEKLKKSEKILIPSILGIFIAVNVLYFFNLIPPIPLSLRDGGVYHSIHRDATGNYIVESESSNWWDYLSLHENFYATLGDSIYAYSAIFSPESFNTAIVHEWQTYNTTTGSWVTVNRVPLFVVGGRDGGYRTYSRKDNITGGIWRVNVMTSGRQIIGRLRFNVLLVDSEPTLTTQIKE